MPQLVSKLYLMFTEIFYRIFIINNQRTRARDTNKDYPEITPNFSF